MRDLASTMDFDGTTARDAMKGLGARMAREGVRGIEDREMTARAPDTTAADNHDTTAVMVVRGATSAANVHARARPAATRGTTARARDTMPADNRDRTPPVGRDTTPTAILGTTRMVNGTIRKATRGKSPGVAASTRAGPTRVILSSAGLDSREWAAEWTAPALWRAEVQRVGTVRRLGVSWAP